MCSVCKEFIMIRFHQVNNFLIKQLVAQSVLRLSHTKSSNNKLYPLNSKKLIRMKGNDAFSFLQGLITNDMRHFQEGAKSIYAMFLNNKGRVLYDSLIHKWETDDQFLLECDHKIQDMLLRHLKIYKLKRAIEIEDVSQYLKLWAYIAPENSTTNIETEPKSGVKIYKDPRLNELGFRIISARNLEGLDLVKNINNKCIANNEDGYKELRYRLGVCEGAEDLPSGLCFPLEVNCDYLHGVSFHKGCYIGQELTARVHHTGVVRKRIMPLKFYEPPNECLAKDTMIYGDNVKSSLGKLKGMSKEYGIGLFRIKETLEAKVLSINTHTIEVVKPKWWPLEAPKEKVIKNE